LRSRKLCPYMADYPVTVGSVKIMLAEPFSGEIRASKTKNVY